MITDPRGRIEYVNPMFVEVTGYSREEAMGANASLLKSGEHGPDFYKALWRTLKAGKVWCGVFRNKRKNGELYWDEATLSPVQGPDGAITHIVATQTDITERRQAEEALRLSEARYALAQRAARIGSWDWDLLTGTLSWSEIIEPMFGFAPGTFPGTFEAYLECVHPDDREAVQAAVKASLEGGTDYAIEHRVRLPDGGERRVEAWGDLVRDERGKPVRLVGVIRERSATK
jgi:PAS domain S-box-containing protein